MTEKPTYAEQTFAIEFGRRLQEIRIAAKVSQGGLADALGVHRNRVHHWETGAATVSLLMVLRIVGVLRGDLNALLPSTSFVWGRELPKRPPQRYATIRQVVAERDPPLTAKERRL
jgi:transcriptional regulator with XRE-family HTH domain